MKRRISSKFLVILMAFAILVAYSVPAAALPSMLGDKQIGGVEASYADAIPEEAWNFDASTGELKGFASGTSYDNPKDLVIPDKIGDVAVKSIGDQAFMFSTYSGKIKNSLNSITLPEGLESIGRQAFQTSNRTMENETTITLPSTLKKLDYRAFYGWDKVTKVEFADGIELEAIGEAAFYGCYLLSDVNLPDGLKTIGPDAFKDTGLTSIEIPDSVETINATAFSLSLIREFTTPSSLTSWNKKANGSESTGTNVMFFRTALNKVVSDTGYTSQGTLEFTRVYDDSGLVTSSNSGAVVNPQPVTINYVDAEGKTIKDSEEAVGAEYNTVDETQGTYTTQYSLNEGGGDKHLYFNYENPFTGTTYVYSNSQGGKDWAAALIGGNYFSAGSEYEFTAPKVPGYSSPASQTKTITADDHEVTFVYTPLPKVKLTTEGEGVTTDPAAGEVSDESEVTAYIHEPENKKLVSVTVNDVDVTDDLEFDGVDYSYTFNMNGDTHVKATYKDISSGLTFNVDKTSAFIGDSIDITNLTYRGQDIDLDTSTAVDIKEESGKKFVLDTENMTITPQESGTYNLSAYLVKHPDTKVTRTVTVSPVTVYVTINNKGTLAVDNSGKPMANREVKITDLGTAEKCYYDLAMVAAHKAYNKEDGWNNGGGYANKLWGIEGTNNLFFTNGVGLSNGVLQDTVKDGDYLYASVNADDVTWGDFITKFDKTEVETKKNTSVELTLTGHSGMAYTEEGRQYKPLKNVQVGIMKDGKFEPIQGAVTDENGKVTVSFDAAGEYVVTAQGVAEGEAQDWNLSDVNMNFDPPYTPPIGKWDYGTFEFSVAYTDKDYGDGPYPADEIKYASYMDDDWEDLHYLKNTTILKDFPIMAPACVVTVAEEQKPTPTPTPTPTPKPDDSADKDIDSKTPSDATIAKAKTDKKLNIKASSITTSAKTGKKTMTVKWKKVAGATNYRIAYKKAGAKKWTYKWSQGKNSVVLTKMKNKGLYEFKLQAVKKTGSTWTKSSFSKSNYRYYAITKQTVKAGKKAVTVKAKKVKGATGYQVLYSTKKNMKGFKVKSGKKPTVKVSKLKKGTRYYVQVRPVKKYKGKTYIGILSAKKSAKAK